MRQPAASASIDAPIHVVWAVMLDTDRYAEWNPFVESVQAPRPPAVGRPIVLHVRWANGRTSRSTERISALEPPSEPAAPGVTRTALLSYVYEGLPARLGLVRGVRHQRLTQVGDGPTSYDTVEEFSGPLVALAGPGRIAEGFRRHAAALKARAEALASS